MLDVGQPPLGAIAAFFGARGLGAGFADRLQRGARRPVGRGKFALGLRQPVGGGAARGGRGFDLADQRLALSGEFLRRVTEFGPLASRLFGALADRGDLSRGALFAFLPAHRFGGDRPQPAVGEFGFARDCLGFDAHLGKRVAVAVDHVVDGREFCFEIGGGGQGGERLLRVMARGHRLVASGAGPLPRLLERRDARRVAVDLAFGRGMRLACGIGHVLGIAPARARLDFRGRCSG